MITYSCTLTTDKKSVNIEKVFFVKRRQMLRQPLKRTALTTKLQFNCKNPHMQTFCYWVTAKKALITYEIKLLYRRNTCIFKSFQSKQELMGNVSF